jgi:hypothetical protein
MSSLEAREIGNKDFKPQQRATKLQVNAEEMLAELKRVVESSTPPPSFRPPSAAMVFKPDSLGRRAQIDKEGDRRIQATADNSAESRQPTVRRKATTPIARSWKLAAGLTLVGAAIIGATFALMNSAPELSKRELAVVATEGPVRPQSGGQTVEPSSAAGPLMQDSRPTEPSQVGALETRPDAAPAHGASLPAGGEAVADAPPQPASLGLESVAPAFTPAQTNPAPAPVAPQPASQDGPPTAGAPSATAPTAGAPTAMAPTAGAPTATAPTAGAPTAGAPTATPPSAPASTVSALPAETPKANATATAHVSTEAARPSTPKIDSARKAPGKPSLHGAAKTAKASAKPVAQADRRSPQPAPPNETESPSPAAQGVGNPTPVATPAAPSIQQQFADGMTHAFSYVAHLPGALLPHSADSNTDANPSGSR